MYTIECSWFCVDHVPPSPGLLQPWSLANLHQKLQLRLACCFRRDPTSATQFRKADIDCFGSTAEYSGTHQYDVLGLGSGLVRVRPLRVMVGSGLCPSVRVRVKVTCMVWSPTVDLFVVYIIKLPYRCKYAFSTSSKGRPLVIHRGYLTQGLSIYAVLLLFLILDECSLHLNIQSLKGAMR